MIWVNGKVRAFASDGTGTGLSVRENDQPDQSHRQHPNDDNDEAEQPIATHREALYIYKVNVKRRSLK